MKTLAHSIIRLIGKGFLVAVLVAIVGSLGATPAGAFPGILTDMQGQPVDYPTIPITLRVYNAASGGDLLWEEIQQIAVANGAFTIEPGQGETTFGAYDESQLHTKCNWFELECDGDVLGPRQEVSRLNSSFEVEGTFFAAATEAMPSNGPATLVLGPSIATGGATLWGDNANTHINLGFGTSVTGTNGANYSYCTVGGGYNNAAQGDISTIGGGENNTTSFCYTTIGGGQNNTASGDTSTVGGGDENTASVTGSTVGGGYGNTAAGDYSWAGGAFMQLSEAADRTFVWGYATSGENISTADAFLIFPSGGTGCKVGIRTKNPGFNLEVIGTAGKTDGGSWSVSSDGRLKKNIKNIESEDALATLCQLQGVTFEWINPEEHVSGVRAGVIAQDLEKLFPHWVEGIEPKGNDKALIPGGEKAKALTFPHDFNAYVIEALKQLRGETDQLRAENDALKARIAALEAKAK